MEPGISKKNFWRVSGSCRGRGMGDAPPTISFLIFLIIAPAFLKFFKISSLGVFSRFKRVYLRGGIIFPQT